MMFCGDMKFYLKGLDTVYDEKGVAISLNSFLKEINKVIDIRGASDFEVNVTENSIVFDVMPSLFIGCICNYPDRYGDNFSCELILDEISMKNFKMGNYDEATSKIKILIDKMSGKIITSDTLSGTFIENEQILSIIEKCKKGELNDSESLEVYLNYLKESRTNYEGFENFWRYLKTTIFINNNVVKDRISKLTDFEWLDRLKYNMAFDKETSWFISAIFSILVVALTGGAMVLATKNLSLLLVILKLVLGTAIIIPVSYHLLLPVMFHGYSISKRIISRLKNKNKINRKIQQIESYLNELTYNCIGREREENIFSSNGKTKDALGHKSSKSRTLDYSFNKLKDDERVSDRKVYGEGKKNGLRLKRRGQNSSR